MKRSRSSIPVGVSLLLMIAVSGASASAQTVSSFHKLAALVESGDRITVTDTAGQEQTGRVVDVSPSALALLINGERLDYREEHVDTIHRTDSVENGIWFGLGFGAGFGALLARNDVNVGATLLMLIGGGVGVGALLDYVKQNREIVYQSTGAAGRVTVAPVLTVDRRGVAVSFSF